MEFTRTTLEIENSLKFFKIKKLCNGPLFYPESQNYEKNQLLDGIKLLQDAIQERKTQLRKIHT
jgi:hypothetical protein